MIKVVLLVGALVVNPSHSCKPATTVSFFKELNENYQLFERAKAAAGGQSSSVPCFKSLSLDTTLFSADVITDLANGINLYMGPDSNITEMESIVDDGRIREAHPIWGVMMITIPFLPMMVIAPVIAMMITAEKELCTKLGWTLLAITLSLPLTAAATPCMFSLLLVLVSFGWLHQRNLMAPTRPSVRCRTGVIKNGMADSKLQKSHWRVQLKLVWVSLYNHCHF